MRPTQRDHRARLASGLIALALLVACGGAFAASAVVDPLQTTPDTQAPTIAIAFPLNNQTIKLSSPTILATVTDTAGVVAGSIGVAVDGSPVVRDGALVPDTPAANYSFDAASGGLRVSVLALSRALHSLTIVASDTFGNQGALTNYFRVSAPVIASGLSMITLPYPSLAYKTPGEAFGLADSEIGLARWVPSDSGFSKYHIYPDDLSSFSPSDGVVNKPPAGLGYFVSLGSEVALNIDAPATTDASYEIALDYGIEPPRGWNLIGSPYDQPVAWGSVEFVSANGRQDLGEAMSASPSPVTNGVLFHWVSTAGGGYYSFSQDPTQMVMEPLAGYWLHVNKDATLVVPNPVGTQVAAVKPAEARKAPAMGVTDWSLQLRARAGKYEDPINYFGVSPRASDGYDVAMDISEPPPLLDTLRMYFPQDDWGTNSGNYAQDMRSGLAATQTWDVEVACRVAGAPVTISWPDVNASVPQGVALRLTDLDTGATIAMRTASGYTFTMAEPGTRSLRITASTGGNSTLAITGMQTAQTSGGMVTFTYGVSRDADVSIEIRNIAGVLVRTLAASHAVAGQSQTAVWNGVSDRGARAPAGKYFARVTARVDDGQTVQALRPFDVAR